MRKSEPGDHEMHMKVAFKHGCLNRSSGIGLAAVVAFALLPGMIAAKTSQLRPQKMQTRFLATSICMRETWGTNEDDYLAEIVPHEGADPLLIRVVDEYPNLELPLSNDLLTSRIGSTLRVMRDFGCDIPYSQMQLRTASGDPMAILPERLGYQPTLDRTPSAGQMLPCYRTVRR